MRDVKLLLMMMVQVYRTKILRMFLNLFLQELNLYSFASVALLVCLLFVSDYVYKIWIGGRIVIPFKLSITVMIYSSLQILIAPYSTIINGLGKLNLGVYSITVKLIIYIPLALILGHMYGAIGIVSSMAIIQIPSLILEPLQVHLIVNKKASGLWNK